MAKDTIILSPEYNNTGRREAKADGQVIICGTFVKVTANGFASADAGSSNNTTIATENIAVASDIYYEYGDGDLVFAQAVPSGCLVQIRAVADTYTHGPSGRNWRRWLYSSASRW